MLVRVRAGFFTRYSVRSEEFLLYSKTVSVADALAWARRETVVVSLVAAVAIAIVAAISLTNRAA